MTTGADTGHAKDCGFGKALAELRVAVEREEAEKEWLNVSSEAKECSLCGAKVGEEHAAICPVWKMGPINPIQPTP